MLRTKLDWLGFALVAAAALIAVALLLQNARAAGSYPEGAVHKWFDSLRSAKGLCCSFADGRTLADPDWGTKDDHYWVIVDGVRYRVPDDAVVSEPNKYGSAVVWPYKDEQGQVVIRCFMPGAQI
jgi:hypothetical protein